MDQSGLILHQKQIPCIFHTNLVHILYKQFDYHQGTRPDFLLRPHAGWVERVPTRGPTQLFHVRRPAVCVLHRWAGRKIQRKTGPEIKNHLFFCYKKSRYLMLIKRYFTFYIISILKKKYNRNLYTLYTMKNSFMCFLITLYINI